MIKDLRILFKPEEKTLKNLNKVLEKLGDDSWTEDEKVHFIKLNKVVYWIEINKYYAMSEKTDGTEISLTEFYKQYDKEPFKVTEVDDITKMKELYESEPDDWVVFVQWEKTGDKWFNHIMSGVDVDFVFTKAKNVQIIATRHKEVADAVIANPNVEVEFISESSIFFLPLTRTSQFFNNYCPKWKYRLAPTETDHIADSGKKVCSGEWNGGYIEASQEAYDKLVELEYEGLLLEPILMEDICDLLIMDNKISIVDNDYTHLDINNMPFIPFYLVAGEFTETKPTSANNTQVEESCFCGHPKGSTFCEKEGHTRFDTAEEWLKDSNKELESFRKSTENTDEHIVVSEEDVDDIDVANIPETISITDNQGKEYKYEKHEYEIHFNSTFKTDLGTTFIIGYVVLNKNDIDAPYPFIWSSQDGKCWDTDDQEVERYNLTPIHQDKYTKEIRYGKNDEEPHYVKYELTEEEYLNETSSLK